MGMLDWLLGAYLAKKAHNAVNRQTVTSQNGKFDIVGMEPVGTSKWRIYIRKRGDTNRSRDFFDIHSAVQAHHCGGDTFDIFWPGK